MELRQLEALSMIASTGSFAAAAERLHLTQPALSHQIRNLESEFGVTLLIRARPKVYASPAGELVLAAADRILREVNAIREYFPRSGGDMFTSPVHIASTNLGFVYLYGDLCEAFLDEYPNAELIFRATETPEEALRRVLDGSADIAFGPVPQQHPQLTVVTLGVTDHVFLVGKSNPLADADDITLEDIRQLPFIRFQPHSGSRELADSIFLNSGGYPHVITESNDAEYIKRIVGLGAGVALMPVFAVRDSLQSGRLRKLKFEHEQLAEPFGLFHRSNVTRKPIEALKALCLKIRGPLPKHITADSAEQHPFRRHRAQDDAGVV